jgi:hypothetical protein
LSGQNGNQRDPIGAAIGAVEKPTVGPMRQWGPVQITSTGRHAIIALPVDASDGEIAEVAGWLLTFVMATSRAERAKTAGGRIVLPPGILP